MNIERMNEHLDAIEDARYAVRIFKLKRNFGIAGLVLAVLIEFGDIVLGAVSTATDLFSHADLGGVVAGVVFLGIGFGAVGAVSLATALDDNKNNRLRKAVRIAQRRYEREL